jgi:uncharacterized membrane protein
MQATSTADGVSSPVSPERHHMRFHLPHRHVLSVFGDDWLALKAEAFARFFGTPLFLAAQTIIVAVWIGLNVAGLVHFDIYPFILLNLAFSLQAAYAAPLILLAQTRQADRDKLHAEADAQHREALALASEQRQALAAQQTVQLVELLRRNTELTELTKRLSERIEALTAEMHRRLVQSDPGHPTPKNVIGNCAKIRSRLLARQHLP